MERAEIGVDCEMGFSGEVDNPLCARMYARRAVYRGLGAWSRSILLYSQGWSTLCPRAAIRRGVDFVTPTSDGSSPAAQSGMVRRSGVATGALWRNRGRLTVSSRRATGPGESGAGIGRGVSCHRPAFPRCAVYSARACSSLCGAAVPLSPPRLEGPCLPCADRSRSVGGARGGTGGALAAPHPRSRSTGSAWGGEQQVNSRERQVNHNLTANNGELTAQSEHTYHSTHITARISQHAYQP